MVNSGKFLEGFVNRIEKLVIPLGFTILPNERVINDDGIQIAEFDIEISGKIGTTNFKWLIECRDRPTQGAAPGSWIEQLMGRRDRFNFDKVIAVSTTGFTEGARIYAKESGIEIRTVTEADLDEISDWFLLKEMSVITRGSIVNSAKLIVDENEGIEIKEALGQVLATNSPEAPILVSTESGRHISVIKAFEEVLYGLDGLVDELVDGLYEGINPEGTIKKVNLRVTYPQDNSHYVVESKLGNIRIKEILFEGDITLKIEKIPIMTIKKYENVLNGEVIATSASFDFELEGKSREISFNKISETGEIHVVLGAPKKHPNIE
jgi:hypothetical protein